MKGNKFENISQEGLLGYFVDIIDKYIYHVLVSKKIKSQLKINS